MQPVSFPNSEVQVRNDKGERTNPGGSGCPTSESSNSKSFTAQFTAPTEGSLPAQGQLNNTGLTVLLHAGATANFISQSSVAKHN